MPVESAGIFVKSDDTLSFGVQPFSKIKRIHPVNSSILTAVKRFSSFAERRIFFMINFFGNGTLFSNKFKDQRKIRHVLFQAS